MKKIVGIIGVASILLYSCAEVEKAQYPTDSNAPGQLMNCKVVNGDGTALITYDLPADDDLLYVKASYKLDDGRDMEVKASAYVNEVKLIGFGKSKTHKIELRTVDRSSNESEPVEVEVTPRDNPIFDLFKDLKVTSDFGGLCLKWKNPFEYEVTISVTTKDDNDMTVTAQNFYSKSKEGIGYVRGYSTATTEEEGRAFSVQILDRWGNSTEVKDSVYYPIFEQEIPNNGYANFDIPGAQKLEEYSSKTKFNLLWDGLWGTNDNHYHSKVGKTLPMQLGMNLGKLVKLSRIKYYQRSGGTSWRYLYAHGNPKKIVVYGAVSKDLPLNINEENEWIKLTEFISVKPSGLPLNTTNADDQAVGEQGEDILIPIDAPAVRVVRFEVGETWSGVGDFIHIAELTYFGKLEN